jgi:hypothetical protein
MIVKKLGYHTVNRSIISSRHHAPAVFNLFASNRHAQRHGPNFTMILLGGTQFFHGKIQLQREKLCVYIQYHVRMVITVQYKSRVTTACAHHRQPLRLTNL